MYRKETAMESWWEFAFWIGGILVVAFGFWPSPRRPQQGQARDGKWTRQNE
jgi:hypothetical protein